VQFEDKTIKTNKIFAKKTRNILKICQKITPFYMKNRKKCLFIEFFSYLCIQLIKAE